MPLKTLIIAAVTLLVGLAVGWFVGRAMLEKQWGNPLAVLTAAEESRAAQNDADPTPKAGTPILKAVPLLKARDVAAKVSGDDPLRIKLGAVGRGNEGAGLHLVIENRGKCKATAFSGVAYGYDAFGRPVKMNRGGEHYVAFAQEKAELAPGASGIYEWNLKHPETASLAVAHVDAVTCDDGTKWARP